MKWIRRLALAIGVGLIVSVCAVVLLTPERDYQPAPEPPVGAGVREERCFVGFRDGELDLMDMELRFWEYPNEEGKGRTVCTVDPGLAEGRVLDETSSSVLVDAGRCTGWVSKAQVTEEWCE